MINYDIAKEMLEIQGLKYSQEEDGTLCVAIFDEKYFPYRVAVFINIVNDALLVFHSEAIGYNPTGNLIEMANRHNCRSVSPSCHITDEGKVVFTRAMLFTQEVSPIFMLENVFAPGIFLTFEAFMNFERSDDEYFKQNH
ncbi:MAG: hypothetical protein K2L84_09575 [Muribaculaceae bacterium]|nr:hypothetical protein [Muribaculaceae bacterium]